MSFRSFSNFWYRMIMDRMTMANFFCTKKFKDYPHPRTKLPLIWYILSAVKKGKRDWPVVCHPTGPRFGSLHERDRIDPWALIQLFSPCSSWRAGVTSSSLSIYQTLSTAGFFYICLSTTTTHSPSFLDLSVALCTCCFNSTVYVYIVTFWINNNDNDF